MSYYEPLKFFSFLVLIVYVLCTIKNIAQYIHNLCAHCSVIITVQAVISVSAENLLSDQTILADAALYIVFSRQLNSFLSYLIFFGRRKKVE